jgi:signal transduction histidine kinase
VAAPSTPAAPAVRPAELSRAGDGLRGMLLRTVLPWVIAIALSIIALVIAASVYDVDQVGWVHVSFVSAVAGLPLGLVVTRPVLGWALSTVSAFLVMVLLEPTFGGDWSWLVVHGVVVLVLLIAVSARSQPRTVALVWSLTCAVFGWGLYDQPGPGIIGMVMAAAAVGLLAGRLMLAIVARSRQLIIALPWVIAIALSIIALVIAASVYDVDQVGWVPVSFVSAVAGLPLGLVVTRPLLGWALSTVSAFLVMVLLQPTFGGDWTWLVVHGVVFLVLLLVVCIRSRPWIAVCVWLHACALVGLVLFGAFGPGWIVVITVTAVIGLLAGRLVLTIVALGKQRQVTDKEKAQRLVLVERARIARDLHDIVAHHMSLIVVQTETTAYRVANLTPGAEAELASINSSAREALTETRSLLSVLRREDDPAVRAPAPSAVDLSALVEAVRGAGVPIMADIDPVVARLRPATALAVYRIVQEALANAARHAPGGQVRVQIAPAGPMLTVEVVNGPAPGGTRSAAPGDEPGHGILGMSERAAAEGGTLSAGASPDGGYAVSATIPLLERAR